MARAKRTDERPVSMAQVAKAAGVSQQTVSRVVNGQTNVSDDTRKRVQAAMNRLGFRPSFAGRSLRSGLYRSVGLCVYDIQQFGNLSTLEGIMAAAREHGYATTMIELPEDEPMSLGDATRQMLQLPVDAMIVSMSIKATDFEKFRPSPALSTVLLTMYAHPSCTTVDSDQYGCSKLVMDYLRSKGHREIRFVAGPKHSVDSAFREQGWRDELRLHGLREVEPLRGDWGANSGYEAGAILAADERATAVYVANDQMAQGVMEALRDAGRRVPEDVSVVGVDDSLGETIAHNRLTTVRFDLMERGRTAFEHALLGTSAGYNTCQIRIPGKLVERETVASLA